MVAQPSGSRLRRNWPQLVALGAVTAFSIYLCYRLALPFLPALAWAVALAILGLPLHRRLDKVIPGRNWSAGVSTVVVVLLIGVPTAVVAAQLVNEAQHAVATVQEQAADDRWREYARRVPVVGEAVARLDVHQVEGQLRQGATDVFGNSLGMVETVVGGLFQALVAVFILFFCFRDRRHLLDEVRKLLPLAPPAAERVMTRAEDAVHATVYGTFVAAALQAVTGGVVWWLVGLPAPVFWASIMFVLGVLPMVGAVLVWAPAAAYLIADDRWGAAAALAAWGVIMAGPVCNYVYAYAAGDRMRMHPVPTLLAYIGGLAVFGVSGMVLGPCVLAVTAALLDVWRQRAADGAPVATPEGNGLLARQA
jgi:predicted PurR-regulated permease PerM